MGWGTEERLQGCTLALSYQTCPLDQGLSHHIYNGGKFYLCLYAIYVCMFVHSSYLPWACALEGRGWVPRNLAWDQCHGPWCPSSEVEPSPAWCIALFGIWIKHWVLRESFIHMRANILLNWQPRIDSPSIWAESSLWKNFDILSEDCFQVCRGGPVPAFSFCLNSFSVNKMSGI